MNEPIFEQPRLFEKPPVILCLFVIVVSTVLLVWQGRVWWCQAGDYSPWAWDIWTTHNSQHIIDPYAFTHVLHGVLEFWLIGLVFRRMPLSWRLFIAVLIESTWEVAENSSYIIERYRTVTLSLDYFGDSIINSLADIFCCATGFTIAYKLKFWKSLALFLATEAILIVWIRDSLLINIIMLIYPIEALKVWQMGGH
ncbi:MAG TPA: DUF2585 family protein [Pyrinomonadaceae bacterium]|nr:DUF2585 family protein [Pyrinomonadaceae bacterium]